MQPQRHSTWSSIRRTGASCFGLTRISASSFLARYSNRDLSRVYPPAEFRSRWFGQEKISARSQRNASAEALDSMRCLSGLRTGRKEKYVLALGRFGRKKKKKCCLN